MKKLITAAALTTAAFPLVAGTASAAEAVPDQPSASPTLDAQAPPQQAQSPLQGASAGAATAQQLLAQFADASNGNGPVGADGVETEIPQPDYRFVEAPAGGLLKNGPFA